MIPHTTMPQTDAVERPLTLVEELEQKRDAWFKRHKEYCDMEARIRGCAIDECINIVKQHSEWIPVSEEIPVLEVECGFRSFEPTNFYQIIDNEGCLHNAYFSTNHYANDDRALFTLCELSLYNGKWVVDDEYEVITVDMAKYWKALQHQSEVQDAI